MKKKEILDMTLEDFDEIKDILISDFDEFWTPEILKKEIIGENKKYIVVRENNQIVGFAGLMLNIDEAEIMNIVTKKEMRKKGIGTLLLEKIIEIAKNNNLEKIFLEVNENNKHAIKLYQKAGFQKIGIRKKYYHGKDNAIIMSKKIKIL